ncbi:MAG: hypothetical protein ACRC1J_02510 [Sandaracinobacteroides sp.]
MTVPPAQTLKGRALDAVQRAKRLLESPGGKRLKRGFSALLSILILLLLVDAIAAVGWRNVIAALPLHPLFWILFIGAYALPPIADWWIYRRWWGLGAEDIGVFLKMRVMNEALFSYSGHTYLLVWAAARMGLEFDPERPPARIMGRGDGPGVDPATSPFAAVKDMAITSGLAGNLATLLMLIAAIALGGDVVLDENVDPATMKILLWSFGAMIVLNVAILAFRGHVMSIPVKENLFAFRWHLFRVLAAHMLLVGSWVVALPHIPFGTWFLLGALRMVIGRMPLPNKELLFAAIAVGLTGDAAADVAALMAAQGALHLIFHAASWIAAAAIERGPARSPS